MNRIKTMTTNGWSIKASRFIYPFIMQNSNIPCPIIALQDSCALSHPVPMNHHLHHSIRFVFSNRYEVAGLATSTDRLLFPQLLAD
jgi:hypothetical protein